MSRDRSKNGDGLVVVFVVVGLEVRVYARFYDDHVLFRGDGGQWQVFVVSNSKAKLVDVTVGLTNDRQAQILAGLEANDTVIVAPESNLTPGQRVSH